MTLTRFRGVKKASAGADTVTGPVHAAVLASDRLDLKKGNSPGVKRLGQISDLKLRSGLISEIALKRGNYLLFEKI
jgi:hypothetical protein